MALDDGLTSCALAIPVKATAAAQTEPSNNDEFMILVMAVPPLLRHIERNFSLCHWDRALRATSRDVLRSPLFDLAV
jgi:hypothetical protein